jgi:hypothetical protein
MLWSWYMANDTQFYVLGILLLLASVRCVPSGSLDDICREYELRRQLPEALSWAAKIKIKLPFCLVKHHVMKTYGRV